MNARVASLARAALARAALAFASATAIALEAPIPRAELKSGRDFTSPQLRALQDDGFANPGMLWIAPGERLWRGLPG